MDGVKNGLWFWLWLGRAKPLGRLEAAGSRRGRQREKKDDREEEDRQEGRVIQELVYTAIQTYLLL